MSRDVVVVGAGVVGCAVARSLAPDHDVCVLERGRVAGGATGHAAGLCTPAAAYADLPPVARHADAFVESFAAHHGVDYVRRPSVEPVPPVESDAARRRVDRLQQNDAPVSYLDAAAAADRFPELDFAPYAGALCFERAGFFDPVAYARALLDDAREHGATVRTGVEVQAVTASGGRVDGVETADGPVDADAVVLAAGPWTDELVAADLPLQPYRAQCAVVDVGGIAADAPLGVAPDGRYVRPTYGGDLLVGGPAAPLEEPAAASHAVDDEVLAAAADLADRLLVDAGPARPVAGWAGVDVATPDARPLVDAPDVLPDGLVLATGFTGLGVSVAPAAAGLVRSLVSEDGPPSALPREPFAFSRFDGRSREYGFLEE